MSQLPIRMLQQLLANHGRVLGENAELCRQLMLAECPLYPRHVEAIVAAVELGVVNELNMAGPEQRYHEVTRPLVERMTAGGAMSDSEALAAVEAWVQALGIPLVNAPFVPLDSLARVEEQERQEQQQRRREAAWAGGWGGALAGLLIAGLYATIWWFHGHNALPRGAVPPVTWWVLEWVVSVAVGTIAGALAGALAGAWLRQVLPTMSKLAAGASVGLLFGISYFPLWAPLVEKRVAAEWGLVIQLLLASLVGLAGGTLVGLAVDYFPKKHDLGDDPEGIADVPMQRGRPYHFS
ncbi:hypothetical protein AYO44_17545 [Planctomycetaceae bacterium SCGC AG-212-F19]|nr:hypothetical protein AYO44_17545 [Planctomycetaceae bacterium SCGC AG-212-F19]